MLRIALIGPFPPPYGGMANYFMRLEEAILSQGVQCEAINVVPSAKRGLLRYVERLMSFVRAAIHVSTMEVSVIHCITGSSDNLWMNGLLLLAARWSRKPAVLSVVGADLPQLCKSHSWLRRVLVQLVLSWPERVIACNSDNADAIKQFGVPSERVVLLSNALPVKGNGDRLMFLLPERFTAFQNSHQPVLLSISAWYYQYGSLDLLCAFVELRKSFPQLGLVLIFKQGGDVEFVAEFNTFIADKNLSEHVLVLMNLPDIAPILCLTDIFVRTPHTDGDSLSVREALAMGLPVVASAAGYRPDGTILFKPGDSVDLGVQLEMVLTTSRPLKNRRGGLDHDGELNLKHLIHMYQQLASPKSVNDNY